MLGLEPRYRVPETRVLPIGRHPIISIAPSRRQTARRKASGRTASPPARRPAGRLATKKAAGATYRYFTGGSEFRQRRGYLNFAFSLSAAAAWSLSFCRGALSSRFFSWYAGTITEIPLFA